MHFSYRSIKKIVSISIVGTLFVFIFLSASHIVSATTPATYTPLAPISGGGVNIRTDLGGLFLDLFKYTIAASAVLALFMIILGGVQYMSTEAISPKGDAKRRIQSALLGLLLVMLTYLILQTINPKIVDVSILGTIATPSPTSSTPVIVAPPRSIPVSSNSGNTSASAIQQYYVKDSKNIPHIVSVKSTEDAQTVDLANLYTFQDTSAVYVDHENTLDACTTYAQHREAAVSGAVVDPCTATTYWYATVIHSPFGDHPNSPQPAFKTQTECETAYRVGDCGSQVYYDVGVTSVPITYTNYTQEACQYMVGGAKEKSADSNASCVKQSGTIDTSAAALPPSNTTVATKSKSCEYLAIGQGGEIGSPTFNTPTATCATVPQCKTGLCVKNPMCQYFGSHGFHTESYTTTYNGQTQTISIATKPTCFSSLTECSNDNPGSPAGIQCFTNPDTSGGT